MSVWLPSVAIDDDATSPLSTRIARAISDDVQRGRLRPGAALPGSRTLADSLGVHRNTVLAAYEALRAEGWLEATAARDTRIAASLPERAPRRFAEVRAAIPSACGFEHDAASGKDPEAHPRSTIALFGGTPDTSLFPHLAYARALRRALKEKGALDYGDPRGDRRLRVALAEMLSSLRGVAATEENVLVTRGSQMALSLAAHTLLGPGDLVACESLTYRPATEAFASAGATVISIPLDREGMRVDRLEALCATKAVRAVYVTPHHQYPTTVTMSASRRLALLDLAKKRRFAVIEDDYDHEFHYEGRPVLPMASADRHGSVVYVGTLSKLLAPGLRLGFVVAPTPLIATLAERRRFVDRQGDTVSERALAELLEEGEIRRHARRVQRLYRARRDAFIEAIERELPGAIEYVRPPVGMSLWARLPGRGSRAFAARCLEQGVLVHDESYFSLEKSGDSHVRLGFAAHNERTLREAVRRMSRARSL